MRRLTVDQTKCPGRLLCCNAIHHIMYAVELDGCIRLAQDGLAGNLENYQLFD